jgi:hypothetical protein
MRKSVISIFVVSVGIAVVFGAVYVYRKNTTPIVPLCPMDVMMCPDGSSVPRSGPKCEFGVCKQELPYYLQKETATGTAVTASTVSTSSVTSSPKEPKTAPFPAPKVSFVKKITIKVQTVFEKATEEIKRVVAEPLSNNQQAPQNNIISPTITIATTIDETRYTVQNNNIINASGTVIYTLPPSTPSTGTHTVNVVPVSNVPPVIASVPVDGAPGKYYLSENTITSLENCEFSNKIYILDTIKNTRTLLYEENNTILPNDDPRACNNEMFLLATGGEKLILKYHTVGTNMVCDSTWSEPEKTWYLDVTHTENGTRHYLISPELYSQAEVLEATCRAQVETATTTPVQQNAG